MHIWRLGLALGVLLASCTNNPYPDEDASKKIEYLAFAEAPKTLDPQVSYTTSDQVVIGPIYDTLFEYHYTDRPYRLIPGLASEVPEPETRDGHVVYRLRLRDDLLYQNDPCFAPDATRQVVAGDVAFSLMRIADPLVNSPIASFLSRIDGLTAFGERLAAERARNAAFAAKPPHEQYAQLGGIPGVHVLSPTELEIRLTAPHPQLLYWFAMPFTAPVPYEAVAVYDGRDGRDAFAEHPVGTGAFRLARYDKRTRIVLERNDNWYGIRHPEWRAPGAVDPTSGRPLPFLDGFELRLDKEDIPAFTKFLQGYYDASGIIEESFDRIVNVKDQRLSPDMAARGMQLERAVIPSIYYIGFNMDDPVVGKQAGARGRALRQAMSLAIDSREFMRIFQNGRGLPAESPLPPGIFGYDADYQNPYRHVDLERAAALMKEAGYPGGVDPKTGQPLHLTFDTQDTSSRGLLRFQYFANSWRRLGIDVEIVATTYNQFQDKVRRGAYQLFMWGWVADYPDPENFLFLLWSEAARPGGPNTAKFSDPRYDELFLAMRDLPDDQQRLELINRMRDLLQEECPWIELFHLESYMLIQGWMQNVKPTGLSIPTVKYVDIETVMRSRLRAEWNQPVRWPLAVLAMVVVLLVIPAVRTYRRERR